MHSARGSIVPGLASSLVCRTFTSKVEAVEVSASGDLAYTRGTMRYSHNSSKGVVDETGKWVTIYKKIDGQWKVIVDASVLDTPSSGR
jgi:ketosteroid isomerase-like protein